MLQILGGHDWVPADSLSAEFCQYGRVIFQLRREGFEIVNKVVPTGRGGKRGYFKLLSKRESVAYAIGRGERVSRERIESAVNDESPAAVAVRGHGEGPP